LALRQSEELIEGLSDQDTAGGKEV
jgi:hypothetical protein